MHGKIVSDSGVDKSSSEHFKRGKFEVKCEKEAMAFYEKARLFSDFESWNSRHFLLALETIIANGKCDLIDLVDKFKERPEELKRRDSVKEYLANLEEIYNYRMRQRRVIYE